MALAVTSIGEVLIDLTQTGLDEKGIAHFAANPGGAPANVAVAAARLGAETAFVGRVGADPFGEALHAVLEGNRVNISGLSQDPLIPTSLAVVTVDARGERSFSFYRNLGADMQLTREQIPNRLLEQARIVHFGSVSLTAMPARGAVLDAVRYAKARGKLISYDPNYRAPLWSDPATAKYWMRSPLPLVDILKVSDEEAAMLADCDDLETAAAALQQQGIRLILITLGARGVYYHFDGRSGTVPGCAVSAADTNGAGDTFLGAVLSGLARRPAGLEGLTQPELEELLRFANQAAALTTTRSGAIPAMPSRAEVEACLARQC